MSELITVSNTPALTLDAAKSQRQELINYIDSFLVEGVDYGNVPGTDKPSLLKPGAEKIASFLGLYPDPIQLEAVEDWTGEGHGNEPFFHYRYKCALYRGSQIVGQGIGSCNSWEKKYRWRWVDESELPPNIDPSKCQQRNGRIIEPAFAIDKKETGGKYGKPLEYWEAFEIAIQDGNATKTTKKKANGGSMDAWMIESTSYRVPNEDIFSQVNTVDKMAQKRALVAAILVAANVSELFTQDMEDLVYDVPAVIIDQPEQAAEGMQPELDQPESDQKKAYKAFYAAAKERCELEPSETRLICQALGISFDPSKVNDILDTLCKETKEPSCYPSLIVAANHATRTEKEPKGYYHRNDDLMSNQFHLKGSVEKLHPDIVWPNPGNPKAWSDALMLAIEYAKANQQDQSAEADLDNVFPRDESEPLKDISAKEMKMLEHSQLD